MYIENLSMSFGLQTIFDDITVQFNDTDKVGIVGVNGAGKSTLFTNFDSKTNSRFFLLYSTKAKSLIN